MNLIIPPHPTLAVLCVSERKTTNLSCLCMNQDMTFFDRIPSQSTQAVPDDEKVAHVIADQQDRTWNMSLMIPFHPSPNQQ